MADAATKRLLDQKRLTDQRRLMDQRKVMDKKRLRDQMLKQKLMENTNLPMQNISNLPMQNTNFSKRMAGPGKGVIKRSGLQKSSSNHDVVHPKIKKGPTSFRLQDEVLPADQTMQS